MVIKQRLQFLNSLGLRLKHKVMFPIRQCQKVFNAIIVLYPIKVMNNPTSGHRFIVGSFPNKQMFIDIALAIRPAMFRLRYSYIAIDIFAAPTFPKRRVASHGTLPMLRAVGGIPGNRFPTGGAGALMSFAPFSSIFFLLASCLFYIKKTQSLSSLRNPFFVMGTPVSLLSPPSFLEVFKCFVFAVFHIYSIPHCSKEGKVI